MEKTITLEELANYAATISWQGFCEGSVAPGGDWDPTTEKWIKRQEAAEIIIADFFFSGDINKARNYINDNSDYKQLNVFIGDPDAMTPEDLDTMEKINKGSLKGGI